ncbi:MAG: DUF58 domain-containing protein [Chloroflexota bacterium]|nr:DUF58 domain-containing protein [Chloroflexota bacterium]
MRPGSSLFGQHSAVRRRIERIGKWFDNPDVDIDTRRWLLIAGAVALLAAFLREPILALIAFGVALVALLTRLWWDNSFRGLTYERKVSQNRAFYGDTVEVELTATNAKPLPLTRLEISDQVTSNVDIVNRQLDRSEQANARILRTIYSLGMYERVQYTYRVPCRSRGWHRFGPAVAAASDPLGLTARREAIDGSVRFLVYPRMVPMTTLIVPPRQPFGDFKPQQSVIEDPLRMAGVREYVAGDSPKRIHWRATARTGTMQTRVYEPSASPVAAIFLDTITFSYLWEGQNSALLELAVTTAASLSSQLLQGRHQVGVYANAPIPNRSRTVRVPPGRRPGQLTRILEELATLVPAFGDRIERMVMEELPRLPWGSTVVIVTCRVTEGLQRSLLRLARNSGTQRFVIVAIGLQPTLLPDIRRRIPVYHLSDEEAWDTIEQITMTRQA